MSRLPGAPALVAAALAAVAAVVASQDGDRDIVPLFVALTLAAGVHAWAAVQPTGWARATRWVIAGGWVVAAVWIGVLLGMYQAMCACSYPPRPPEPTYLGLPATAYHLAGLYGGGVLIVLGSITSERGVRRRTG
ncbi:MAG: hypothetical protein ACRDHD_01830 [Candidatus Limnocylindria bacterium]